MLVLVGLDFGGDIEGGGRSKGGKYHPAKDFPLRLLQFPLSQVGSALGIGAPRNVHVGEIPTGILLHRLGKTGFVSCSAQDYAHMWYLLSGTSEGLPSTGYHVGERFPHPISSAIFAIINQR